jgi:microcystin degradation protein MlrC
MLTRRCAYSCADRCQVLSTEAFTNIGVHLAKKTVVVVKSSQHFYPSFSRIAAEVR